MANIAVVVPCYNVKAQIGSVLEAMPPCVARIFVVDDCCPEKTGEFVRAKLKDSRIRILTHEKNQGVGGAVMTGYKAAIAEGMDILVKIDGDGQMDPSLIETLFALLKTVVLTMQREIASGTPKIYERCPGFVFSGMRFSLSSTKSVPDIGTSWILQMGIQRLRLRSFGNCRLKN